MITRLDFQHKCLISNKFGLFDLISNENISIDFYEKKQTTYPLLE